MRCLLLFTCLVLSPSLELAAQAVPDTTSPARYAPLHVGNVWHYEDTEWYGSVGIRVERVLRDSTIHDTTYAVVESLRYHRDIDGNEGESADIHLLRFDSTRAVVRTRVRGEDVDDAGSVCRLDTPFPSPQEGYGACAGVHGGGLVFGSLEETITIGDTTITTAAKGFDSIGHGALLAAGIGRVSAWYDGSPIRTRLTYARIDGQTYGTPLAGFPAVVSSSASPTAAPLTLRAFPSPTAGPITLALDLPSRQPAELAAFDVLGRRVWRRALATGRPRVEVDASAWAPGLYLVRATAGDASATTTVVRR